MGKVIFWIVIAFIALFALRLLNIAKAKGRERSTRRNRGDPVQPMVRCARCGVFLPSADATKTADGYRCTDPACAKRR
jgi:hypothetical protein